MQQKIHSLVNSNQFAIGINLVILINATLIGVETFYTSPIISALQTQALFIFTLEIALRYIGRESSREYFTDWWNIFDIVIVGVCYIPESLVENSAALSVFRVMRVFRILRLVKMLPELKIIVDVLLKSIKSLGYTFMLLVIFMYMYAVMGVILFKGGSVAAGPQSPDPYGSITEAFFTLLRIMTGEDWTDLRYNLLGSQLTGISDFIVTTYHVSWIGLAAFLLINLVVGAVVNNYDQVMSEIEDAEAKDQREKIGDDIKALYSKIDSLSLQLEHLTSVMEQKKD
ncbi:ion transporter [Desulfococcaceae bacterium HSG8]|nr:ion transporter [Desulfococcaceae bacterium HSG8]